MSRFYQQGPHNRIGDFDYMGEFNRCLGEGFLVVTKDDCKICSGEGKIDDKPCVMCNATGKDDSTAKEWKLAPAKGRIKAAYESWIESNVRQQVINQKPFLGIDDYLSLLLKVNEKIALHKYSWGEPAWRETIESSEGLCKLFQLMLGEAHAEVRGWDQPQVKELLEKNYDGFRSVLMQILGGDGSPPKAEPAPKQAPATTRSA